MAKAARNKEGCYRLGRPSSAVEWAAYRGIRHAVAFGGEADEQEELAPGHFPLLLWLEECPVGTIRIDMLDGGAAAFRLVAVHPSYQGRGHGFALLQEAEAFAREIGCRKVVVYATPEAVGFYAGAGYAEDDWDDQYFGGIVQMTKPLAYAGFGVDEA
ncbi:MAG TPA: GNAT family N-acetyltransferase [Acetobacteraceae bacterium]